MYSSCHSVSDLVMRLSFVPPPKETVFSAFTHNLLLCFIMTFPFSSWLCMISVPWWHRCWVQQLLGLLISSAAANRRTPSCDIATYNHSVVVIPYCIHLGVSCTDAPSGSEAAVDPLGHLTEFCVTSCHHCVHYCVNLHCSASQCCEYPMKHNKKYIYISK